MEAEKAPIALLIGVVCLAGAATLAWFSSVATLHLVRTDKAVVRVSIESRMFGLVPVSTQALDGVRQAGLKSGRLPGTRSNTPNFLVFTTPDGALDLGYAQQLFTRDVDEIAEFIASDGAEASFSSISRGEEFRRFLFAQTATLFLAVLGLSVLWMAVRAIFPGRRGVGE